jgi:hypothetical protein
MGWPPEFESCPHGKTVGYCTTCELERKMSKAVDADRKKRKKEKPKQLKIFWATHTGVYLGGCSVIVAKDRRTARRLLKRALRDEPGIADGDEEIYTMKELDTLTAGVTMLDNGDY